MTQIPNHPEYLVTEVGEIYSTINNAGNTRDEPYKLTSTLGRDGYFWVGLKGSNKRMMKIHRLVALTFIPNPDNLPVVNHLDGDKTNNTVSNLEWCTYSENTKHAVDTGLMTFKQGEDHSSAKLTNSEAITLIELSIQGYTNEELGEMFGLHPRYVSLVRHGKRQHQIWETHFKGVKPVGSDSRAKSRDLVTVEAIVEAAFTTNGSNAQIGRDFNIDASTISRIRNNDNRVQGYFKPFMEKYLKIENL